MLKSQIVQCAEGNLYHVVTATAATLILGAALAAGCEDPATFEVSLEGDPAQADDDPQAFDADDMDLADAAEQDPSKKLICPDGPDPCPIPLPTCYVGCNTSSPCSTACKLGAETSTCGGYGVCMKPCSQVCSPSSNCGASCGTNGNLTYCGYYGTCNYVVPDCLVEFWTGYNYTGKRDCYGSPAEVEQAAGNIGKLTIKVVQSNDQYSSFRTIEQVCRDNFIYPCHIVGVANKVKTGAMTIYKDANQANQWAQFVASVDAAPDLSKKYWQDNASLGNTDDKLSSFAMDFTVAPSCYQAVGFCPGLCTDGGAQLYSIDCTVSTDTASQQGWAKVDPAKNVWVRFSAEGHPPTKYEPVNGQILWRLEPHFKFVYPGSMHDLDWVYDNGSVPALYFQGSVPGAF